MKNTFALWLLILILLPAALPARCGIVEGRVRLQADSSAVVWATVRLLRPDSALHRGTVTTDRGTFRLDGIRPGRYVLQVSYVGLRTQTLAVTLAADTTRLQVGTVWMPSGARELTEARVVGRVEEMEAIDDTLAYNAAAYRVPEGSALEELVKRLPGVEVGDDGSITVNGKRVTQFLVNGKDFFKGKTNVAMKNLPVDLVKRLKTYDKKSDYTEQTGIDDGEEETVMDVELKRELNESWVASANAGYATNDLYEGRLFVNRMTDYSRVSLVGNARNPNGTGHSENAGLDFNVANYKDRRDRRNAGSYSVGGSADFSRNHADRVTGGNSETYLTAGTGNAFSHRWNHQLSRSQNVSARLRAEWHPDTLTSLSVNPSLNYGTNRSGSLNRSAEFNADPYGLDNMTNPLDAAFADEPDAALRDILVNRTLRQNDNAGHNLSGSISLVASRRLSQKGRSVDVSASAGGGRSVNRSYNRSDIRYYRPEAERPQQFTDQFTDAPAHNWNYRLQAGWNEPLFTGGNLQLRYRYQRSHRQNDRSLFRLDSLPEWGAEHALGELPPPEVLQELIDLHNSRYTVTDEAAQTASVGFRWVNKKVRLNLDLDVRTRLNDLHFRRDDIDTALQRRWTHALPSVRFRYRFTRHEQLEVRYNTSASAPALTNLINISDNSDPQNISLGNPDLRASWTNNLTAYYNRYNVERRRGWNANLRYSQTARSISTAVLYDANTGVRTRRPQNINGNWNTGGGFSFNGSFGPEHRFRLNSSSDFSYNHSVGFIRTSAAQQSQKNTNRALNLNQRLSGTFRNEWLEVELNTRIRYNRSRNRLNPDTGNDTYHYGCGTRLQVRLPWRMTIETDASLQSRRGYDDPAMNTDEWVWNARISQNFFPKNAGTLTLRLRDILHQRTGISQNVSASGRSDSWNEQVYSYAMLQFTYRLNIFKGGAKGGRQPGRGGRARAAAR